MLVRYLTCDVVGIVKRADENQGVETCTGSSEIMIGMLVVYIVYIVVYI